MSIKEYIQNRELSYKPKNREVLIVTYNKNIKFMLKSPVNTGLYTNRELFKLIENRELFTKKP